MCGGKGRCVEGHVGENIRGRDSSEWVRFGCRNAAGICGGRSEDRKMPRLIGCTGQGAWIVPGGGVESRSMVSASAVECVEKVLQCVEVEARPRDLADTEETLRAGEGRRDAEGVGYGLASWR
jgi:hypothetical protein